MSKLILNHAGLFEEDGRVAGIEIFGEGRPDEISSFWEIWAAYLPQNVVDQYGFPDRVWFDTYNNPEVPNPDKPIGYSIWFFYDEKDFLVVYSGITTKPPEYQVCLGEKSTKEGVGNLSPYIQVLIHKGIPLEEFAIEREVDRMVHFKSETNGEIPIDDFKRILIDQKGCFNNTLP